MCRRGSIRHPAFTSALFYLFFSTRVQAHCDTIPHSSSYWKCFLINLTVCKWHNGERKRQSSLFVVADSIQISRAKFISTLQDRVDNVKGVEYRRRLFKAMDLRCEGFISRESFISVSQAASDSEYSLISM